MAPRSEKQRAADKRYADKIKGRYKAFTTQMRAEEVEHADKVLTERGMTKADFIRRGIARLERGEDL